LKRDEASASLTWKTQCMICQQVSDSETIVRCLYLGCKLLGRQRTVLRTESGHPNIMANFHVLCAEVNTVAA